MTTALITLGAVLAVLAARAAVALLLPAGRRRSPTVRWARLRLELTDWPRHGLVVTDTARPDCPDCHGRGGWDEDVADASGEYADTEVVWCGCWDPECRWLLLPLPRRLVERRLRADWPGGYSDEPPF
ncbi:hypothetical protein [Streptomyces sp. URMC 129]|uniref:hypothetical protein n=1 Tax=Streptomyces sp. URMC 129 TaxID=3423407 RepID=UPI003F1AAC72